MKQITKLILMAAFAAGMPFTGNGQVTLGFDLATRGPKISDYQYGIFYEEINNAGDGGLYAEQIRNRCFEDSDTPEYWSKIGGCTMELTHENLMNENRKAALHLTLKGENQGVMNGGYWGIKCDAGETFTLTLWLKSDEGYTGTVNAVISGNGKATGATGTCEVNLDSEWKKVVITMLTPEDSAYIGNGKFVLRFSQPGDISIGMVSLFPTTYKGRENGCRKDLAEMLEALNPKFVRFPGGCYIEGDGTVEESNRFEWKKTIGPIEERPGHYNRNWGYPSTDGLGFHEFLQLSEDLGAAPLFVVNVGIGHGWVKDHNDIGEYIQEALDAIEYSNGGTDTYWGKKRAENGHPESFNLRFIEIGNENYQNDDDQRSDHYAERYKAFYEAISAKYPEITLIGNVEAWGTDDPSWRNPYPVDIVDEHYYRTPEWFELKYNKYDSFDRNAPKVYVGEYAVTDGYGTNGHLKAALGEAVYMQGLENNSDVCVMASYAPIFFNEERGNGWIPDMIRFTNEASYGTPSYYVQQLMSGHLGKQNVKWTEEGNIRNSGNNKIGLSSWSTCVEYDNITVTDKDGNELIKEDFSAGLDGWNTPTTDWSVVNGVLAQHNGSEQGAIVISNKELPRSYTLELDARKTSGAEGFLIVFNAGDNDNYSWWNIGGWNNTKHGLQVSRNGKKLDYDLKDGFIKTGDTYHIKIEVDGSDVKCYLDGEMVHHVLMPEERNVYVSSSVDDESGLMYVKLVNTTDKDYEVVMNMTNAKAEDAEAIVLTSGSETDENTIYVQEKVVPAYSDVATVASDKIEYHSPAHSLSIVTVKLSDINYDSTEGSVSTIEKEGMYGSDVYTTTGMRVKSATDMSGLSKGIYIVGGKKVIAK